jgi:hypothetical protein
VAASRGGAVIHKLDNDSATTLYEGCTGTYGPVPPTKVGVYACGTSAGKPRYHSTPKEHRVMQTSLARRLLAGAAGLMIGAAGSMALAAPAHATVPTVDGEFVCDEETGEWVITWTVTNSEADLEGTLTAVTVDPEADLSPIVVGATLPVSGAGPLTAEQRVPGETEQASLAVEVLWLPDGREKVNDDDKTLTLEGECKKDDGEEPPPPTPPITVVPGATCEFALVFVRNDGVEEPITMALTPNEDTAHGHGGAFLEFFEDPVDGVVEIPEGLELEIVGDIAAGDTVGPLGPFEVGAAHVHGFEAFAGLEVQVVIAAGEEVLLDETFVWDELAAELDCEDDGEGGGLPVTGMSTGLLALGALVLLAIGGGLYLAARRRRVTFTT